MNNYFDNSDEAINFIINLNRFLNLDRKKIYNLLINYDGILFRVDLSGVFDIMK